MIDPETRKCPSPETLAKFIDGRSWGPELQRVVEHLESCGRCRCLVEAAAEEELEASSQEAGSASAAPFRAGRWWWSGIAAAAFIGIVAIVLRPPPPARRADPVQK